MSEIADGGGEGGGAALTGTATGRGRGCAPGSCDRPPQRGQVRDLPAWSALASKLARQWGQATVRATGTACGAAAGVDGACRDPGGSGRPRTVLSSGGGTCKRWPQRGQFDLRPTLRSGAFRRALHLGHWNRDKGRSSQPPGRPSRVAGGGAPESRIVSPAPHGRDRKLSLSRRHPGPLLQPPHVPAVPAAVLLLPAQLLPQLSRLLGGCRVREFPQNLIENAHCLALMAIL